MDNNNIPMEDYKKEILFGDCFELMPKIKDKSVDLIFADLPYGATKCKWDSNLPLDKLWAEYKRIIKDNGCVLLFAQTPFDKVLGCSNLEWLKYEWIWEKTQATGFFNAKKMPMKAHENILVFYKNPPTYNPQKTIGHKPMNYYTKKAAVQNKTQVYGDVKVDVSGGGDTDRYPRSVQTFSSDKQKTKLDGTIHPTQKPVALVEYFIKTYTNEGDLVLDNVAGSGTVAVACEKAKRQYIVMENEKEYYDIILKRVDQIRKINQ